MSVEESEPNNEESLAGSDSDQVGDENTANADQLESEENDQEDSEKVSEGSPEEAEIAALKDQLLRNAAEFENLKRRTFRDVENAHKFGRRCGGG